MLVEARDDHTINNSQIYDKLVNNDGKSLKVLKGEDKESRNDENHEDER
jgi:hypothetical protein